MTERAPLCEVTRTAEFAAPAAKLWELVADFGGIDRFLEGIETCELEGEGVGAVRRIPLGTDAVVVERLDILDPEAMTLSYSIVDAPLPFSDYSATMTVAEAGNERSILTWTGRFAPDGLSADDAKQVAAGIYSGGIAGFTRVLASENHLN